MLRVRDLAVHAFAFALLACGEPRHIIDADAIGADVPDVSLADAVDDFSDSRDSMTDAPVETVPRAIAPMPGATGPRAGQAT